MPKNISIKRILVAGIMAFAGFSYDALVLRGEAYAGGAQFDRTCAQINPNIGGTSQRVDTTFAINEQANITLQPGDILNVALAPGPNGTVVSATVGMAPANIVAVPTQFTNSTNAEQRITIDGGTMMSDFAIVDLTCGPPVVEEEETSTPVITTDEIHSALSPLSMNSQNQNLVNNVDDATSKALSGSGTSFPFVNQSGFSISTRDLYAKRLNTATYSFSNDTGGDTKKAVYGTDVSLGQLSDISAASPLNVWVSGNYNQYEGSAQLDGHIANISAGVDYLLQNQLVIGALFSYGDSDLDVVVRNTPGSLESEAYTVGLYAGKQFDGSLIANGYISYSNVDYNALAGTTTGSYDADRYSIGGRIHGSLLLNQMVLQPTLSGFIASENVGSYVDSTGATIASQNITAGRISVGPKLIFETVTTNAAIVSPYASVNMDYDFADLAVVSTTLPNIDDTFSASVEIGFNAKFNGAILSLSGRAGGLGANEFENYGGEVTLSIPLQK